MNNYFPHFSIKKLLDLFGRDKSGNVAILFGMTLIPLIALGGSAIDFLRAMDARTTLRTATDAAAIAAVKMGANETTPDDEIRANIQTYMDANWTITHQKPEFTFSFNDAGNLVVQSTSLVKTVFLSVIGIDETPISALSEVATGAGKIEVAMVLDNTGSMAGSKIIALKDSTQLLLDTLFEADPTGEAVKVGIVPFAEFTNVGETAKNEPWLDIDETTNKWCEAAEWTNNQHNNDMCDSFQYTPGSWHGCVAPRANPYDASDEEPISGSLVRGIPAPCHVQEITRLTNSEQVLDAEIEKMQSSGWTYIPVGMEWGWKVLSPEGPYADGADYDDEEWIKAMLVFTDGANTAYFPNTGGTADQRTEVICNAIKDKEIKVYTITFEVIDTGIKDLMQQCASSPSWYFDAADGDALKAAFQAIANDLNKIRLAR